MPKGIAVEVSDGFAEIDFVDRRLRGPGLQKLLEVGGPETIETLTRSGPRRRYRVPEGNAREAGLLDTPSKQPLASGDTGASDALAQASPAGARPDTQTVTGRAYGSGQGTYTGPLRPGTSVGQPVTSTDDVLGGTSVQTSLVPGSGTGESVAPLHADVIQRVKPAPQRQEWPDGEPSVDWKRAELDAYAASKGIDSTDAANKADVVELINKPEREHDAV